jgi:hypothetical protein
LPVASTSPTVVPAASAWTLAWRVVGADVARQRLHHRRHGGPRLRLVRRLGRADREGRAIDVGSRHRHARCMPSRSIVRVKLVGLAGNMTL